MKQLTLEILSAYLPYEVRVGVESKLYPSPMITGLVRDTVYCNYYGSHLSFQIDKVKPILHPLSSLLEDSEIDRMQDDLHGEMSDAIRNWISYFNSDVENIDNAILCAPYPIIRWALKNHYDIYSLITSGLAVRKEVEGC